MVVAATRWWRPAVGMMVRAVAMMAEYRYNSPYSRSRGSLKPSRRDPQSGSPGKCSRGKCLRTRLLVATRAAAATSVAAATAVVATMAVAARTVVAMMPPSAAKTVVAAKAVVATMVLVVEPRYNSPCSRSRGSLYSGNIAEQGSPGKCPIRKRLRTRLLVARRAAVTSVVAATAKRSSRPTRSLRLAFGVSDAIGRKARERPFRPPTKSKRR